MKKLISIAVFVIAFLFSSADSQAQFYAGAGFDYLLPMGKLKETNDKSIGFNISLESRKYCRWWYGLRVDYISFEKAPDLDALADYYDKQLLISPTVRFNLANFEYDATGKSALSGKLIPYLNGMFNISSIKGSDKLSQFGLGASLGAGLAYSFTGFDTCWLIDLNGLYSAPNCIERDDARPSLESILVSLSVSVCL